MGQFRDDIGWYMGVSGELAGATQFNSSKFGGPHQLRAFLLDDVATGAPLELDTPVESGRFTHLTMTYRYIDGTSNEIALYKDGRLEASGTTNRDIVFDATNTVGPDASIFNLGGSTDGSWGTDSFEFTSGWGHLVSGAYVFRRVLHEGEILEMHQRGGLQPDFSLRDNATEVDVLDSNLVAYVEGKAPGWVDASKNHYNFISEKDPGDRNNNYVWDPGPFITNQAFNDGASASEFIVVPSGATFDIAEGGGGFTISAFCQPVGIANSRDDSMMISMGSVSTATTGPATPASVSTNSLGFVLTYFFESGFGDRIVLEVFPIGDGTDGALTLRSEGEQIFRASHNHYAIVYDAASRGVALYMNGYEAASGTLTHHLQDHLLRLAGSGFPVIFANGVTNQISDSTLKGVHGNGGDAGTFGPFALFSRPLRADEIRYVAQSGVKTSAIWRTRHDPSLMGYWPCDTFSLDDVLVEDRARAMSPLLGHLTRGDTNTKWERVYNLNNSQADEQVFRDDGTAFVDLFNGEDRTLPPELDSFGNLGITSGVFGPQAASQFGGSLSINQDSRNTPFNSNVRWLPATEERDDRPQNLHEYIISFEVTPSGNIPAIDATAHAAAANQRWFNSYLHVYGNQGVGTSDGDFVSLLTTVNEGQGSGVTIAFAARDGTASTTITPIISGTLPFGVPSKVLFHAKFDFPYFVNEFATGSTPMTISLWIDGQKINQRTAEATSWRFWSDQPPDGATTDWLLQFGGYAAVDIISTQLSVDGGLGDIYMREIFLMRGIFENEEVEALAVSGIQNPTLTGYINQLPTTQVTIADANLEGYWRFNGFDGNVGQVSNAPGGSGTTDLSLKSNHLDAIAQRYFEEGNSVDMAETIRALAGPLRNSDLGVQCSGFHNQSVQVANTDPNMLPPHAVSGAAFDSPAEGFSVGFLLAKRDDVANGSIDALLCYGVLTSTPPNGTSADTTVDPNRGWAIVMDDDEQLKMVMSLGGNLYLDNVVNAAYSGQLVCGLTNIGRNDSDARSWRNYQEGDYLVGRLDYWTHYCWVYDPSPTGGSGVRCYMNGILVDEKFIQPFNSDEDPILSPWTGRPIEPQVPLEPTTRMITFRSHQAAGQTPAAWDFRNNALVDEDSVMTDVFYFSRALSEEEVRYAAFNGIDSAVGTPTSGSIGGFIHGQDTGSGLIGGYQRGLDTGSGLIGGFMPGGTLGSGNIGGYISGVVFGTGTIGGWIRGLDDVSGIIAGYIRGVDVGSGSIAGYIQGQEVGSGHIGGLILGGQAASGVAGGFILGSDIGSGLVGGFVLGGLQGNFEFDAGFTVSVLAADDFDAQIEIAKTVASDFDAKVVIFQNEIPPLVDIIVPDVTVTGLAPPFNQYFVGKASGQQGKTITSTKWTFGDLTPSISVSESGAGCYPVQHMYASSGFFIAKFEAVDSDGLHASATRIVNAASGIEPVIITLSGVPRSGDAELIVDFDTNVDTIPVGVSISTQLLNFDDGQTTSLFNPTHVYTQPGTYRPIWCVRDSRGVIWCDSLESGSDLLDDGGG
jgi:hypothetical protein